MIFSSNFLSCGCGGGVWVTNVAVVLSDGDGRVDAALMSRFVGGARKPKLFKPIPDEGRGRIV